MYKLYAATDDGAPPNTNFEPSGVEEILQDQLHDPFCAEIPRECNEGESVFEIDNN